MVMARLISFLARAKSELCSKMLTYVGHYGKDKNRDVIVAFPDVDPSSILVLPEGSDQHGILDSSMDGLQDATFDRPHLWYPTSKVISALKLFIVGGDQLSGSNTYRWTHEFKISYHLLEIYRDIKNRPFPSVEV